MKPGRVRVCGCKYCTPTRKQRDIDKEYQLPGLKDSGHKGSGSGRHGASSSAATSETIIMRAKDYRNLKKPSAGCASRYCYLSFSEITSSPIHGSEPSKQPRKSLSTQPCYDQRWNIRIHGRGCILKTLTIPKYYMFWKVFDWQWAMWSWKTAGVLAARVAPSFAEGT